MDNLQYKNICEEMVSDFISFKPYYKWITFNTVIRSKQYSDDYEVLNLIING